MGYNKHILSRVRREFSQKYLEAGRKSEILKNELHQSIPELREIDARLSKTGLDVMNAITSGGDVEVCIENLRQTNLKLQSEREKILAAHGLPANATDPNYECTECLDTGYVGIKMCGCMRKALIYTESELSGLSGLLKSQSFRNFSLDYYKDTPRAYEAMTRAIADLKKFCREFTEDSGKSFLFFGSTGLGKTHLSTSVAKCLIENGFDVFYVTCSQLICDFEAKRFSKNINDENINDTERYYSSDLLIIDDLGTETKNQFTMSIIYEIINYRMMNKKSVIINTNLKQKELLERYDDRITSRILGTYKPFFFEGKDIRLQKISRNAE